MASKITMTGKHSTAGRAIGIVAFPWAMFMYSYYGYFYPIQVVLYVVFFLALISLLVGRGKDVLRFSSALGPVLALLIWAGLSLLWSVNPMTTWRSFISIAGLTAYGIMFSFYYSIEEQLRLLALYMFAVALISLLLILFIPSRGIMSEIHPGAWQGIFWHKNLLGVHIALGVVLFVLCACEDTRYRLHYLAGLAACLALLIGSRSLTGAVSALAGLTTYAAVKSLRTPPLGLKRNHVALAWLAAAMIAGSWLVSNLESALNLVGRDSTLTKRTLIWSLVLENSTDRPWLGYGLNSFWKGSTGTSAEVIKTLRFDPWHAHNGLMDLYLELGLIGISIFLVCFARLCIPAYREAVHSRRKADCWGLVFLAVLITCNLPESQLFRYFCLFWMLFVTVTCNLLGKTKIYPAHSKEEKDR